MQAELDAGPDAAGERLDVFLGAHVASRSAAAALIEAGHVTVDGVARPKRHLLEGGERVVVDAPEPEPEPDAPTAGFTVAYEDEHLLVVDKPAGIVVHPARGHRTGTLVQALAGRVAGGDDPERPGIVHRLDRETSGLLVVARSEETHAALKAQMRERLITREYSALVEGRPGARSGLIDAPLGRDRRVRTRISTDTEEPREARTRFVLERALPGSTLLRVTLETGRTHQIRAHLLAIGHPVCGDPDYGTPGRFGLPRQFLHAARLAFAHPVTEAEIDVASPLPEDLAAALARAETEA
ncbi:MAG: Ribosomal large subunit pseudouridine synthase D [uncultured Solirubrobacteraceae bacterium]|uniref:Pseudouridine synthase n=1 Tax=uncultured Solirubrobacteraceae bacterium TaxID=1162706 RepID=A0A6J4TK91_9ACTN|nr:MAG: Ribosomal large subunit pseudouridine synthase D [uncultured Solirubrobacteraceae bacterium]